MSLQLFQVLAFAGGASSAAFLVRWVPHWRRALLAARPESSWPWWLRMSVRPAMLLAPTLQTLLPPETLARTRRRLEAADLHPGVAPAEWIALRLVHAVMAAACAAVVAMAWHKSAVWLIPTAAMAGFMASAAWLRRTITDCERRIVRDLPPYLDLLTVCVEAGATLTAGIRLIVEQAPPSPLRNYFDRVLREVRSGRQRAQAFVSVAAAYGVESLSTLASALSHAESSGMSLGQVLRTQSEQRSAERFTRAERLAMQAPVKMLGPLIFCIFPCTFIVLAVPIVYRLTQEFSP